jgi:hypothetical protein
MKTVIARFVLVALVSSLVLGCSPAPATITAPAVSPPPPTLASATPPPPGPPSPTPCPPYRGDPVVVQENNSLPLYSFRPKTSEHLVAD